ncbi:MAG: glycosyltransferase family 2 protein [candidate division Zixibacteria bacterium]|nr:glycosyltransferase family 2 protein [candidate division Zixibacteria bacterium]
METEKHYGRRRQVRKPINPKKADETEKPKNAEIGITKKTIEKPVVSEKSPEGLKKTEDTKAAAQPSLELNSGSREFKGKSSKETIRKTPARQSKPYSKPERKYTGTRSNRTEKSNGYKKPARQTVYKTSTRTKKTGTVKLSVVVPAFNESGNIAPLVEQFSKLFSNLPYRAELIIVDDGSTDQTLAKAKDSQFKNPWLKIYSHRVNRGITAALETGFSKATGKILCFYPADLQYHANELPKLVSKIDSGADIVTGWKQGKYGLKSIASYIYNRLSRWLFKVKVHDLNSIKVFKKEVIDYFGYRSGWHRYMIVMAAQAGYKVDEVKVKLYARHSGKSKFGLRRLPGGFLDLLSVKFQLSFTKKPLLFFGSAGLISGVLGFLIGLWALYLRYFQNAGYRPLLYAVILLTVSGLMLFAIGFLAELIVGMKDELKQRKNNLLN